MTRTPTTHISSLATLHKTFSIQMVDPWALLTAIDCSTDLYGATRLTRNELLDLLSRKSDNCSEWFETHLAELGIQTPLVVIIRSDGMWQFDDGHHRFSWALRRALLTSTLIPVIFDDSGADQESHLCYLVEKEANSVYHDTIAEDLIETTETLLVEDVSNFLSDRDAPQVTPMPTYKGRHRKKTTKDK